ncbi:hypothetical protein [Conexibacter arvalis]|uniref:Zn-dependent protease with chaperone function n=1 Tax=Conexibacter arvalis TaxID=912552 RepID=A0A840II85_9ACTN|nr:hypothetical protein [Conexibacter arvalis]MBB4664486.1 Zn-dependent protease with chaperone function [Conexibacter arvalis]
MNQTVRNVVIILALAAAVAVVPGGSNASDAILQTLVVVMLGALAYLAVRLYRERKSDLYGLGDRNRAILYGSAGMGTIALVGTDRMWDTGAGSIAWLALIALACFGVYHVYRRAREY